jgi:[acyl-carrier-protein] S-malonyltransferase
MGKSLYEASPTARKVFDQADRVLGFPLSELCFEGPEAQLNDTFNAQPAILTVSIACLYAIKERWQAIGQVIAPIYVAGHSLGEFTALAAAGAVSWETALLLVRERGRIMADAITDRPGGMIAIVGLDEAEVERIRAEASALGRVFMANRNADNQFVLSGDVPAVQEAEVLALAAGARRALILTIPLPAHSPLMDSASRAFKAVLDRLAFAMPAYPILANATGEVIASVDGLRQELTNHLLRPVDWARTMVQMRKMQVKTVVELGPGRVLASLAQKHIPGVTSWNAEELFVDFADTTAPAPT